VAVNAFLGYVPPSTPVGALAANGIREGAANLAALQRGLAEAFPGARVTWVCHSYGSLVCASALAKADPDALVLLGSPGVAVARAAALPTDAPVFAARGGADPILLASLLPPGGGGFGTDPAAAAFGATALPTDPGCGHSDYFQPGSGQLASLASIIAGRAI
jgi:pimeloyl-ACP methyl ester carboxylesterase